MKPSSTKIGILGAGQLGKMLALAAHNWDLNTWALDASDSMPAAPVCNHFVKGDFNNFDDVYAFGKMVDLLTIEIEHVNVEALLRLEQEGSRIFPSPSSLRIIKDKGLQKEFYRLHHIPTADFRLFPDTESIRQALSEQSLQFPFVQKSRTAGYDGKGVAVIRSAADLHLLIPGPSVVEDCVDILREISVVTARNSAGDVSAYPPVEMQFNPQANLVEFLLCPASLPPETADQATRLAVEVTEKFHTCGLLAVEMFLTPSGQLLVNEVAPRPHNSGHHTIDSCYTSQFEQHLRAILNLPLGSTAMKTASVMVNLLGAPGCSGPANYVGFETCAAMHGVKIHLYGKKITQPFRKMGHATVLAENIDDALRIARQVQETLRVIA